jgi:ABC-2 type transport system ATP-binding protein
MEEADRLCERLAIVDKGTIVAEGSPGSLKSQVGGDVVAISIGSASAAATDEMKSKATGILTARPGVVNVAEQNGSLLVTCKDGNSAAPDLMKSLIEGGLAVSTISVSEPTLDDVFLKHTGKKIRTDSTSGDAGDNAMRAFMGLKKR